MRRPRPPHIPYRTELPICACRREIVDLLSTSRVVVVTGTAGCGKSTQLPLMCLEASGDGTRIAVTQPRRLAAVSLGRRLAADFGCAEGTLVGYRTRFQTRDCPDTLITFMTDGILLAQVQHNRLLAGYTTVIIDEAHERNLNIDLLLGYLRRLLTQRNDLRIVISSATLDAALFSQAFGGAPVVSVPGRQFPVEIVSRPLDDRIGEEDGPSPVDAAIDTIEELVCGREEGDLLVFMPTERDIVETKRVLDSRLGNDALILPLFARLSGEQQDAIFRVCNRRKIVIATNIAETSVTVPGIRYVVDTGLARIKRFMPSAGVTRLPVESVSRAAADQRAGRCGRTGQGTCIRLYSTEDYLSREEFTPAEIQRSNLASLILLMAACDMGPVEQFPFLEPPTPRGVNAAYRHLGDLGALSEDAKITPLGRAMARLPVDPHLARMILAARDENALQEVTIIATGLSVTDPREFRADQRDQVALKQQPFTDPGSDFLSYLHLWTAYHSHLERLKTQNQMRKFCREHFLSYPRMREWSDIHAQTIVALRRMGIPPTGNDSTRPEAIHRSILTGLPSHVALRDEEKKTYRTTRGRDAVIFPGSSLAKKGPHWIVCHEFVETSRLFGRTVSSIDPSWIEELFADRCKRSYSQPHFDPETGSVRAYERVTFHGLPIVARRRIDYSRVDREAAARIFAHDGLAGGELVSGHPFLACNQALLQQAYLLEAKLRVHDLAADQERIALFYGSRIEDAASVHELNRLIRQRGGDYFLRMSFADVVTGPVPERATDFPDTVEIGGAHFPLSYMFDPGRDDDGATLCIPPGAEEFLTPRILDWVVPGLVRQRIDYTLKSCPKRLRVRLAPLSKACERIAEQLHPGFRSFDREMSAALKSLYALDIPAADLAAVETPPHVRVHIRVAGATTPDRSPPLSRQVPRIDSWRRAFQEWGVRDRTDWDFGEIPEWIEIRPAPAGFALTGYPALQATANGVNLVLCESARRAAGLHAAGVQRLAELALAPDLAWLDREIRPSERLALLCKPFAPARELCRRLALAVRGRFLLNPGSVRKHSQFEALVKAAREGLRGAGTPVQLLEQSTLLLSECATLCRKSGKPGAALAPVAAAELAQELAHYRSMLVDRNPPDYDFLINLPRYLHALKVRIGKAWMQPAKYRESSDRLRPYLDRLQSLECTAPAGSDPLREYAALIEEFKISLFAQHEVRTRFPVSEKRLDDKYRELGTRQSTKDAT